MEINKIYNEDCFELFKRIPDCSIDCIITDPPYGITACKWDSVIPLEPMWVELKRVIKDNGAICIFGSEPFSSNLRMSNIKMFKYDWIWEKPNATGFLMASKRPLKAHENISIFYKKQCLYNQQKTHGHLSRTRVMKSDWQNASDIYNKKFKKNGICITEDTRCPRSVLKFKNVRKNDKKIPLLLPTQKPVDLIEYFVKTYTNEYELILDFCMGSGTTAIACKKNNRDYIGSEISEEHCQIAEERLK